MEFRRTLLTVLELCSLMKGHNLGLVKVSLTLVMFVSAAFLIPSVSVLLVVRLLGLQRIIRKRRNYDGRWDRIPRTRVAQAALPPQAAAMFATTTTTMVEMRLWRATTTTTKGSKVLLPQHHPQLLLISGQPREERGFHIEPLLVD